MSTRSLLSRSFALLLVVASCKERPASSHVQPDAPVLQAKAFRGEAYTTIDGRTVITIVSDDELEIAENGVNIVSKYTSQDSSIRAVVNTMGMTQAVYYQILADGLQDAQGRRFYTPAGLQAARQQAVADAERAAEEARIRAQEEAENKVRLEALLQESKVRTRTIATFDIYTSMHGDRRFNSSDLTDVDVLGEFWLGGVGSIRPFDWGGGKARWGVEMFYSVSRRGASGELLSFPDTATRDRFIKELDVAVKSWRDKYESVALTDYDGIKK